MDPFTLALIGAGTGALLDKKKPLRGAAIGGSLGYGGGTLLGAGGAAGAMPQSAGAFEASMGLPQTTAAIESAGMVMNPATGTLLNPEYYVGAQSPFATYTGGEGLLSNAMGNLGTGFEEMKPYMNIQNLSGAANVAGQFQQPMARVQSGGGNVNRGQAPQGAGDIASLIQSIKLPEKRRISLL